jgi:hypothetical protein
LAEEGAEPGTTPILLTEPAPSSGFCDGGTLDARPILSRALRELLFEVFSQRYERGATLVTGNLPFNERTSVFGFERLTARSPTGYKRSAPASATLPRHRAVRRDRRSYEKNLTDSHRSRRISCIIESIGRGSSGNCRTPALLGRAPIYTFDQQRRLCRRQ